MSQWKARGKKHRSRQTSAQGQGPAVIRDPAAIRDSAGRVHLVLRQDPNTGASFFGLRAPLFEQGWQNELTVSVVNMSHAALRAGIHLKDVVRMTREAMTATSTLAEGFLANAPPGAVGCKAGCDHCCYQSVGVTTPEALAILDHLQNTLSALELQAIQQRVAASRQRTRGLSSQERYSPDHPCPFLEQGQCSIYEVRPLSCRGMNSLDAAECEDNLRNPVARARFLEDGVGGRAFMEPIRAFHAVSAGLQLALSELFRLDVKPLDLTAAMDELLNHPKSTIQDWLAGQSPLAEARGGDSSNNLQIRALSGAVVTSRNT